MTCRSPGVSASVYSEAGFHEALVEIQVLGQRVGRHLGRGSVRQL
jgi:hypothetical protein